MSVSTILAERNDDIIDAPADEESYVRLSSCPRCGARDRALGEIDGELVARCLNCGDHPLPLTTERTPQVSVVGGPVPARVGDGPDD